MANDTQTIPEERFPGILISSGFYCVAGVIAFVANSLFFASIYKHKLLRFRKEYTILSALVLMDLLQGFAFTTSGVGRAYYIWAGTANQLVTRMGCLAKTWNWVWFPFNDAYGATLLMVSVDRLLSMGFSLRYLAWDRAYALAMMVVFYSPYVPVMLYATYEALKDDNRAHLSQICYAWMVYKDVAMYQLLKVAQSNLSLASFVVYAAVVMLYRLRAKRVMKTMSRSTQSVRLESQRHLMVTLGISCSSTMLLYVAPSMLLTMIDMNSLGPFVGPCIALNHMVNPLLFLWHHKTIRKAIQCLLSNQKLTQNMIDALFKETHHVSSVKMAVQRVAPMNAKCAYGNG